MDSIATYILDGVLTIALGFLLKYGVPYVKSLLTAKNFAFMSGWVEKAVLAAEQTIQGSGLGEKKKAFVISLLEKLEIVVDDSVDALIEAAVKKMKEAVDTTASVVTEAVETATEGAVTEEKASEAVETITA